MWLLRPAVSQVHKQPCPQHKMVLCLLHQVPYLRARRTDSRAVSLWLSRKSACQEGLEPVLLGHLTGVHALYCAAQRFPDSRLKCHGCPSAEHQSDHSSADLHALLDDLPGPQQLAAPTSRRQQARQQQQANSDPPAVSGVAPASPAGTATEAAADKAASAAAAARVKARDKLPLLPKHAADAAPGEEAAGEEGDEEYELLPGASSGEDDEETLDEEAALAAADGSTAQVRVDEGALWTMTSCWLSGILWRKSTPLLLLLRCRKPVQCCFPQ